MLKALIKVFFFFDLGDNGKIDARPFFSECQKVNTFCFTASWWLSCRHGPRLSLLPTASLASLDHI